jgi:hypothetical protein
MAAGRYSKPYNPVQLGNQIGYFRTSPIGVVNKDGKDRIVNDHSWPHDDPEIFSINSQIDAENFPSDCSTFLDCLMRVATAPPGTQVRRLYKVYLWSSRSYLLQASVFDVDAAYRRMPIAPEDQHYVAITWNGKIHIDPNFSFGGTSSPGVFSLLANAITFIFRSKKIEDLIKWVDDFVFFRYPTSISTSGPWSYTYSEKLIWDIAAELGWPWSPSKHFPFKTTFTYIGFTWDLEAKTVHIPDKKKQKFLAKLHNWEVGSTVTALKCESVIGTLNHCCNVIVGGRSHLPELYRFRAGFKVNSWNIHSRHRITTPISDDISWWRSRLSADWCGMKVACAPTPHASEIFIDASTSWGIGFIMDGKWLAWELIPGWKTDDRDIGWAEMVAVELGLRAVIAAGIRSSHIIFRSDNTGVVGAMQVSMSRNHQKNGILRRIIFLCQEHDIWITTNWVPTLDNPADDPSRALFPPTSQLFAFPPNIPYHLKNFVRPSVSLRDLLV